MLQEVLEEGAVDKFMLEILPIKNNELDILLKNNNVENKEGVIAFSAAENGKNVGHIILAQNKDNCEIINIKMNDPDDAYLLDGLVRASAVIAAQRGYTGVYYQNNNYKKIMLSLGFIEQENKLYFSISNLVKNCENCKN